LQDLVSRRIGEETIAVSTGNAVDTVEEGAAFGTWHFVGGTGLHEGVAGRGFFAQVSNSLTGAREMSITGVAVWPE